MAKIETTFIRPKELYTPETGETKVVYDGYQNNPHELVVEENLEGEVSEIVNDTFVPNEGGNVMFTDGSDVEHELITKSGLGKAQVIETTWQALKDLRDNSQLIAGSLYRITDYNCTTKQADTQSAGHQFDIVLLALSANKLAEEGWAMEHPTDVYDVTFADGVKKCYIYPTSDTEYNVVDVETLLGLAQVDEFEEIDEENKTAILTSYHLNELDYEGLTYNYFQNSNLSAWKVWYCLDNDTDRFAWAMGMQPASAIFRIDGDESVTRYQEGDLEEGGENYFAWQTDSHSTYYTLSEEPSAGDDVYDTALDISGSVVSYSPPSEGRGVIYRLIDEWNNDVPYDFKNIQQLLPLVDEIEYDEDEGVNTWVYTLDVYDLINQTHLDASIYGNKMKDLDEDFVRGVTNNLIEPSFIVGSDNPIQCLGKTAMIVSTNDEGSFAGMSSNSIKKYNGNNIPTRILTNCYGCTILENVIFAIFIQCDCCILCNGSTTNRVEQSQLIYKILNQSYKWYITEITGAGNLTSFATMRDIGDIETALNNI